MTKTLMMGAVAYAPKVVTIWEGFKEWFYQHGLAFDYVLYSNYERQVEAQFAGEIDVAWNSPLAWERARRIAKAKGLTVEAIAMRDTDQDLSSVLVVRNNAGFTDLQQLKGKTIGFGAIDSPQATLIPKDHLRQVGMVAGRDYHARLFDVLAGKHGDHIGGERDAAMALVNGEIDATWMIDGNYHAFANEGTLPSGETTLLARTGLFDHCNFTTSPQADAVLIQQFTELLLSMRWDDPAVRPLLELEGLREWKVGRTSGYELLARAVDDERFYDQRGAIIEQHYRY